MVVRRFGVEQLLPDIFRPLVLIQAVQIYLSEIILKWIDHANMECHCMSVIGISSHSSVNLLVSCMSPFGQQRS